MPSARRVEAGRDRSGPSVQVQWRIRGYLTDTSLTPLSKRNRHYSKKKQAEEKREPTESCDDDRGPLLFHVSIQFSSHNVGSTDHSSLITIHSSSKAASDADAEWDEALGPL